MECCSIKEIDFHDAVLDKVSLESNPDFIDTIQMTMILHNENRIELTFLNCFSAGLELSMWTLGADSIRTWSFTPTQKQNDAIAKFFQNGCIRKKDEFQFFNFNLNTTNSSIVIIYQKVMINVLNGIE